MRAMAVLGHGLRFRVEAIRASSQSFGLHGCLHRRTLRHPLDESIEMGQTSQIVPWEKNKASCRAPYDQLLKLENRAYGAWAARTRID